MAVRLPDPDYLTAAQVCALLSVDLDTLRRWRAAGYLRTYRAGPRLIRFDRREVERLLAAEPTATPPKIRRQPLDVERLVETLTDTDRARLRELLAVGA